MVDLHNRCRSMLHQVLGASCHCPLCMSLHHFGRLSTTNMNASGLPVACCAKQTGDSGLTIGFPCLRGANEGDWRASQANIKVVSLESSPASAPKLRHKRGHAPESPPLDATTDATTTALLWLAWITNP
eukprot:m.253882 g.253882  ORF g.253882 m.253882 type:complete len:129 (-) comp15491_c0_seq2:512-898(-)